MSKRIDPPDWWHNSNMDKLDRRTRKTRMALYAALVTLLQDRDLDSITVTELARTADVNRSTFYAHFDDIYDLLDAMHQDFKDTVYQLVSEQSDAIFNGDFESILTLVYSYFAENQQVFSAVFQHSRGDALLGEALEIVRDGCMAVLAQRENVEFPQGEVGRRAIAYEIEFITRGSVGMARAWIEGGCKENVSWMVTLNSELIRSARRIRMERE